MTEADWQASRDPDAMLAFLSRTGRADVRKLTLFSIALGRRFSGMLPREFAWMALADMAEALADGKQAIQQLWSVVHDPARLLSEHCRSFWMRFVGYAVNGDVPRISGLASEVTAFVHEASNDRVAVRRAKAGEEAEVARRTWTAAEEARVEERARHAELLRCIVGSPFRSGNLECPSLAATLAETAYYERIFPAGVLDSGCLAVLADVLEEGGVSDSELLAHLRSEGPHYRGCWALDCVLRKD